jgi:stringent starvation protein B
MTKYEFLKNYVQTEMLRININMDGRVKGVSVPEPHASLADVCLSVRHTELTMRGVELTPKFARVNMLLSGVPTLITFPWAAVYAIYRLKNLQSSKFEGCVWLDSVPKDLNARSRESLDILLSDKHDVKTVQTMTFMTKGQRILQRKGWELIAGGRRV